MWWLLTILFFLITVFCITVTYFSLKRINEYENLLIQMEQIISFANDKMKNVDDSGHYESDDETSFFFSQLKELQSLLNNIFEVESAETKEETQLDEEKE